MVILDTIGIVIGIFSGLLAIVLGIATIKSWVVHDKQVKESKAGKGIFRRMIYSRSGRIVSPILVIVLLVTGYLLVPPKKHLVVIPHHTLAVGENIIHLKSASPPHTNRWLFWDYLLLKTKSGEKVIWKIGRDDGSHAEFDHYGHETRFRVGTPVNKFPQEINDLKKDEINILFILKQDELGEDLELTLDSSSGNGLYFKVYVEVRNSKGIFEIGTYDFRTFWF